MNLVLFQDVLKETKDFIFVSYSNSHKFGNKLIFTIRFFPFCSK